MTLEGLLQDPPSDFPRKFQDPCDMKTLEDALSFPATNGKMARNQPYKSSITNIDYFLSK